jgi:hypothetical protein
MKTTYMLILLGLFAVTSVFADELNITVYVNGAPEVRTISFTDLDGGNIQVYPNDTAIMNCSGTLYDVDGANDIGIINATFFASGSGYFESSPAASGAVYINNTNCSIFNIVGTDAEFECLVYVHHHSLPGTWSCNVTAFDSYNQMGTNATTNTVDVLRSIQLPNITVDFGTYPLNTDSGTNDFNVTYNNTGNVAFDTQLDAYRVTATPSDANAMLCTVGNLPVGSLAYSYTAEQPFASKTPLTDAPIDTNSNLLPTAVGDIDPTTQSVAFGIGIPASGLGGRCVGWLDISAI